MSATALPQFLDRAARKRAVLGAVLITDVAALLIATFGATWVHFGQLQAGAGFENMSADVSY